MRNITDIDDKIINRANENQESIDELTGRYIDEMHHELDLPTLPQRRHQHIASFMHTFTHGNGQPGCQELIVTTGEYHNVGTRASSEGLLIVSKTNLKMSECSFVTVDLKLGTGSLPRFEALNYMMCSNVR